MPSADVVEVPPPQPRAPFEPPAGSGRQEFFQEEHEEWEAVGKKKKSKGKIEAGKIMTPIQQEQQQYGSRPWTKKPFFGLWVGNVHNEVVNHEVFRQTFEGFGELCNAKEHGVPPINILPPSSSAFVNFCRYEDADAARTNLQGKTVGSTGPLRINASDLMQKYEEDVVAKTKRPAEPVKPAWSSTTAPSAAAAPAASVWNPAPEPARSAWAGPGAKEAGTNWSANQGQGGQGQTQSFVSAEEQRAREREEQERRDMELARRLQKQEEHEAASAFYMHQAEMRKRQAGGQQGSGVPAPGYPPQPQPQVPNPRSTVGAAPAHPPVYAPQAQAPPPGLDAGYTGAKSTLMDHLPSTLRGSDQQDRSQGIPNAWAMRSRPADEGYGPGTAAWGPSNGSPSRAGHWGESEQAGGSSWSAGGQGGQEQWETAGARRRGRGRGSDEGDKEDQTLSMMFGTNLR